LRLDPLAVIAWIARHPHIGDFLGLAYIALPVVMVITWLIEQNIPLRRAELIGGYMCFVFYLLLPAVGPGVYNWTANAPAHGQIMLWRNCMPSMHFAWALLMARYTRGKILKACLWVFAALTAAGTIAVGQHYFIDLIAAVPYVFAVEWLAARVSFGRRVQVSAAGVEP
jgi:membrane-associated phospholipid phosphatase